MKYLSFSLCGLPIAILTLVSFLATDIYEHKLILISLVIQVILFFGYPYFQKYSYIYPLTFLVLSSISVYPLAKIHEYTHLTVVVLVFGVMSIHYLIFESLVQQEITGISRIMSIIGYSITTLLSIWVLRYSFSFSSVIFVFGLYSSFVVSYIPPKELVYQKYGILVQTSIAITLWGIFLVSQGLL